MGKRVFAGGAVGLAMIGFTVLGAHRDAAAATMRNWRGTVGANWSEAGNWSPGGTPENGDLLIIGSQGTPGTLNNNIPNLALQRLTLDDRDFVIQGNPLTVADIIVEDGGIITYNSITLDIGGVARTVVFEDGSLSLSGNNTFTGDIDIYGRLRVGSNTALGTAAGNTRVLSGGELELAGRDLGNEVIQLSSGGFSFASISNSLDSVIPNLQVGGRVAITNSGKLNLPNGIKALFPGTETFLAGSGDFLVGGTSTITGTVYLVQDANLAWNSAGQVAIVSGNPLVEQPPTGDLTGSGTAGSLDFQGGMFSPGTGNATGRFTLTGEMHLQDATFRVRMNGTTAGTGHSQAQAGGPVTLGPGTNLDLDLGFTPNTGQSFRIIDNTGQAAISGTFVGLPEGATFSRGGRTWTITYIGGTGNDVVVTATAAPPTDPRPFKRILVMLAADR